MTAKSTALATAKLKKMTINRWRRQFWWRNQPTILRLSSRTDDNSKSGRSSINKSRTTANFSYRGDCNYSSNSSGTWQDHGTASRKGGDRKDQLQHDRQGTNNCCSIRQWCDGKQWLWRWQGCNDRKSKSKIILQRSSNQLAVGDNGNNNDNTASSKEVPLTSPWEAWRAANGWRQQQEQW